MRTVVDSNSLNSERLAEYLGTSTSNYVVLTDYCAIEAYKHPNPFTVKESFKLISKHSGQVVVLKGTMECCGIISDKSDYPDVLIDRVATANIHKFLSDLQKTTIAHRISSKVIFDRGDDARRQLDRMRRDSSHLLGGVILSSNLFNESELKLIRTSTWESSESLVDKIVSNVFILSQQLMTAHPKFGVIPPLKYAENSFLFRQAICAYALMMQWVQAGKQMSISDEKILNDQIDLNYIVFSSFFDGLLSDDKKLNSINSIFISLKGLIELRLG